jgi:hypothetical protein
VTAHPPAWNPPPELATQPDQLPVEAWRALELFDDERLLRCWRTARGYLVLTTLRCLLLWQRREILQPREWEASPEVLLYNVRPPHVVLGRFVEVAPAYDDGGGVIRASVADPEGVAEEVAASIGAARRAWDLRRAHARADLAAHRHRHDEIAAALADGRPIPVPRVPCAYCGNSMPITARSCPHCGAPA